MKNCYFGMETFGIKIPVKKLFSKDGESALKILNKTTVRKGNRFESGLLWRSDDFTLLDNMLWFLKSI